MGDFKPLMSIDGEPVVIFLLKTILNTSIDEIIVVTGHRSEELTDKINSFSKDFGNSKIKTVFNPNYSDGMFTSIQCGLDEALSASHTDSKPEAVLLFPVDSPLVSTDSIQLLIDAWASLQDKFYVPCYRGKKGHPLLIPKNFFEEILNHDGHGGLKAISQRHAEQMILLETGDERVVIDMDTIDDYHYAQNHKGESNIQHLLNGVREKNSRIILVRHGSTMQHKEKIFLGQSDIPLSDEGREESRNAAKKLLELSLKNPIIWCSTLSRAKETAEIIAENISVSTPIQCSFIDSLKEINLGSWDGVFISEIKKCFPNEYKKRGEDILRYKKGNNAENFYDLRYRILRAFREILKDAKDNQDIIIVTHAGPIRMIISECNNISLDDALKISIPKAKPLQIDGQLW